MIKVEILDIWKNSETHPFSFLKTTGQVENKYSVLICPVLGWWGKNKQSTDATLHAVSFQVGQDRKKKKKKSWKQYMLLVYRVEEKLIQCGRIYHTQSQTTISFSDDLQAPLDDDPYSIKIWIGLKIKKIN